MRIPVFWRAVLVIVAAYVIFTTAFPPLIPKTLLIQFMIITSVSVLLYFSFDDERWGAFKAPINSVLRDDDKWAIRWGLLVLAPGLVAYTVYDNVKPSFDAPVELRQVHPAPPSTLRVYGKTYDLATLENPARQKILALLKSDPDKAWETYQATVEDGTEIYYKNCFYCHGDIQEGRGRFAAALNPPPANFRDVGTIAQLQEAYLFWRITTGGPGLPKEGAPWNSAMPVWHEMLDEEDVWNVITFLYDRVGQVPRMWDQETSKAVAGMNDRVKADRVNLKGEALYGFRCAVCHGDTGAGDGPAAEFLYPKPRDFTTGFFKYKSSAFENPRPTDQDLVTVIKHGLAGTAMQAWGTVLNDEQIRSLIPVVKKFDLVGTWAPEEAPDSDFDDEGHFLGALLSTDQLARIENRIPFTDESVEIGRAAFRKTCSPCHGDNGRGDPSVDKRLRDEWGNRIWPRNLTKPWTWRVTETPHDRDKTIRDIYMRMSVGIPGTPMKAHAENVSEEDRWHIANFVYTLRNQTPPITDTPVLPAAKLEGSLPDDVNDQTWEEAPAITIPLLPNVVKEKRLFEPLSDAITVRAVYNDREIAFLLQVDDRTYSRPGDPDAEKTQDRTLKLHSDAFAIQFPKDDAFVAEPVVEKPLFRHGDARHPTTIWYWNAGSVEPDVLPRATVFDASGVDKKLRPRDNSSAVTASGEWTNGRWRVVIKRSRDPEKESGDVHFTEGRFIPVSFANWDGSNGEVGSMHTLSAWYWLFLPPETRRGKVFGLPVASAFLVFAAGLGLVRTQRRKN